MVPSAKGNKAKNFQLIITEKNFFEVLIRLKRESS